MGISDISLSAGTYRDGRVLTAPDGVNDSFVRNDTGTNVAAIRNPLTAPQLFAILGIDTDNGSLGSPR